MWSIVHLGVILPALIRCAAQEIQTTTVILPASPVTIATTLTSTLPDVTVIVTPTGPPSAQYTSPVDLKTNVLNSTNFFRWEHNATFLKWNASLATYAANYAQQCLWAHSHGGPGENLARGYPEVIGAIDAWGNERDLYNFSLPTGFTEPTGHFTQLVWKATQTVGCAGYNCNGTNGVQGWMFVCEYWPAGNIVGQGRTVNAWFDANVQSQINSGQGYNFASATAGINGVGTSWASDVPAPTPTSLSRAAAVGVRVIDWKVEFIGGVVAFLGLFGL